MSLSPKSRQGGRKLYSYNSLFGKGIIKGETVVADIGQLAGWDENEET